MGKPIERQLAGNEAHSYKIVLAAGQFLHVVVEQKGIDVVVALFAPNGEKVAEIDSPNGTQGEEPISFVSETGGNYRLVVLPLEKNVGRAIYEIKIEELRLATIVDRNRITARRLYLEGEKFRTDWKDLRKSIAKYKQALSLFRLVGDTAGEALTLTDMGSAFRLLDEKSRAIQYYNQALLFWQKVGNLGGEAITLNYLGVIYKDLGESDKALEYYHEALRRFQLVGGRSGEAETLFNIAIVEKKLGNLNSSLSNSDAAIKIIESLRLNFGSKALLGNYIVRIPDFYEFYIDLLMQMDKLNPNQNYALKSFEASEQARARSLLEILTEANADIRQGVDPELLKRERSIQQLLAGKSERLTRISSDEKLKDQIAAAQKEVDDLLAQYQEIEAQIRVKSPRYAALTQPVPSDLAEIQGLLDKDTVLLEYSLGEERSYLWLVTPQTLKSYELPKRSLIEETANRLISDITARSQPRGNSEAEYLKYQAAVKKADAEYPKVSAELSRMILGQIAPEIEGKRLLIVGDGALQYVPFAALQVPSPKNVKKLLIETNEIVYLPSASTLAILRREENVRKRKDYAKTVIVFADPVFNAEDKRVSADGKNNDKKSNAAATRGEIQNGADLPDAVFRSANEVGLNERGGLRRLEQSKAEAEAISNAAGNGQATVELGFDASRERVLTGDFSNYRIVHFATHGLLNEKNPELSGVVLSLVDEQGNQQNGFLRLNEIYNLNLPVEMVVLSACETGLGKKIRGEGLIGLTRGFMYAGAPRVVATLWSVDDFATKELMQIFYQKMLRENLSPAAALRAAQNEIRRQEKWQSPVYWAGFVLQGEWQNKK